MHDTPVMPNEPVPPLPTPEPAPVPLTDFDEWLAEVLGDLVERVAPSDA